MGTQGHPRDVVILSGVRTPFGTFGGALKDFTATRLATHAATHALARAGVAPDVVDHVLVGNVIQSSPDAAYLARHVGLQAGCRVEVPAVTVNRLCGSGFEAMVQGAQRILLGEAEVCLVGGAESMSQAPLASYTARWGSPLGKGAQLVDTLSEGLRDAHAGCAMAETAETLAARDGVTRADADAFALRSQQLARDAWAAGAYADEVVPVEVKHPKSKQPVPFDRDEHMRPDTTAEGLAKLPALFRQDGVVTAGTASGIGDGAAMLVIASAERAAALGATPLARLVSWGVAGVDPTVMGIGPVPATRQALAAAGRTLDEMDLVEVNEAFAAQTVAVERALGIPREKLNVHGGAIALAHPLGASGARITAHLVHALRRGGHRFGLGAACIGGGQGIAVLLEAMAA
jgi:acetyl-CoA acetyltransferase family protein